MLARDRTLRFREPRLVRDAAERLGEAVTRPRVGGAERVEEIRGRLAVATSLATISVSHAT